MAYENENGCIPGLVAAGDLSAHQYKFVVMSSTGVALASGVGQVVIGILQNKPSALGEAAAVLPIGSGTVSKFKAAVALAVGDDVTTDAAGLGAAPLTTNYIHGIVAVATGAANEIGSIILVSPGRLA